MLAVFARLHFRYPKAAFSALGLAFPLAPLLLARLLRVTRTCGGGRILDRPLLPIPISTTLHRLQESLRTLLCNLLSELAAERLVVGLGVKLALAVTCRGDWVCLQDRL